MLQNWIKFNPQNKLRKLILFYNRSLVFEKKNFLTLFIKQNFINIPIKMKYLNQSEAINIDKDLIEKYKFSLDQLMELAGQSCAIAVSKCYPLTSDDKNKILLCCGPGNNGGDGLVCARYLKLFGYSPELYYPKRKNNIIYQNLLHQCIENDIPLLNRLINSEETKGYKVIIDAVFGFSFKPPIRADFLSIINLLKFSFAPICSIDIPSGWDVENGPPMEGGIQPQLLVSLTAPKLCAKHFVGKYHFLGGRFVPKKLEVFYDMNLPKYSGTDFITIL